MIPLERMTCWELCKLIEKETKELGTDDNCPVPEMALEEQKVLLELLNLLRLTKATLHKFNAVRDENDGRLPFEVWEDMSDPAYNNHPAAMGRLP